MACSRQESGSEMLARLVTRPFKYYLDAAVFPDGLEAGHVVEISGETCSGKTQYLLHLLATAILPAQFSGVDVGGLNVEVLFIDTTLKFSILRLVTILEQRLSAALHKSDDIAEAQKLQPLEDDEGNDPIESAVRQCLTRFFLVRCSSSSQFAVTLCSLESVVTAKPNLRLVMLDDLSAFYHLDSFTDTESHFQQCISLLKRLVTTRQLILIASCSQLSGARRVFKRDSLGAEKYSDNTGGVYCTVWRQMKNHGRTFMKTATENVFSIEFSVNKDAAACKTQLYFTVTDSGVEFVKNIC